MAQYISKSALVAEIERRRKLVSDPILSGNDLMIGERNALFNLLSFIDTLEVKEIDLEKSISDWLFEGLLNDEEWIDYIKETAKHFFELGIQVSNKAQKGEIWQVVDNVNHPQADKNKIYCVFTKNRYILATVINHPKDEELLQWKCTEFPHHRYDMCEGDKYMQIV